MTRIAGYASIFGVPDRGGDIVRAGAFARSLAARADVPLLWQHDTREPIGRIERLAEDARGLRVVAALSPTARGQDAAALLKAGALTGLSFGYRVRASRPDRARGYRELTDLELIEVSLVTFPMQPRARVHALADDNRQGDMA